MTLFQREHELVHGEHQVLPKSPAAASVPRVVQPTWWQRHGELSCSLTAGTLLLAAYILSWTTRQPIDYTTWAFSTWNTATIAYHILVGVAFLLGFGYGSAEAWEALREGKLDIHFLMVLGAVLAVVLGSEMEGAILLFLFTLSGSLEDYAMQRTHAALESLMKLFPKEAVLIDAAGNQKKVPLDQIVQGNRVLVRPGENVPADGTIVEGASSLDESAITGEYLPREKGTGQTVFAGTMNVSGRLVVRVDKHAQDTTLAKIIHLVSEAREEKAPVEQLFDKVGTLYTFAVLGAAVASALALHYVFGLPWKDPGIASNGALYRAITFVIVASPCALIISTPVVLLSAIASCARRGIIMKGGRHLESLAALRSMVFDKTGTLTAGKVRLVALEFVDSRQTPLHCDLPGEFGGGTGKEEFDEKPDTETLMSPSLREKGAGLPAVGVPSPLKQELAASVATIEEQLCANQAPKIGCTILAHGESDPQRLLLKVAAALEANSTHPLASAVIAAAKEAGIAVPAVDAFVQEAGLGLRGTVEGQVAILGSPNLIAGLCHTLSVNRLCERVSQAEAEGQTAVVIYYAGLAGLLRFQDTLRPDAAETIEKLHALGVRPLVMLTGDNTRAATAVASTLGLDEVRAELLPEDKLHQVAKLVEQYKTVAMVGDGINDAPALARATVGIAMGGIGSDAALQAADVVLLSDRIDRLPWLIQTSRRARRVMLQNLTFAIGVIVVLSFSTLVRGVPLSLGVIGHEGSTVLVVFNGLRLLLGKDK
jgi:Zn2+/Cd2+-exporting ATPase